MRAQLFGMNGVVGFRGFELDDNLVLDQKISSEALVKLEVFIFDGNGDLAADL